MSDLVLSSLSMDLPLAERFNLVRWSPTGSGGLVESLFLKLHLAEERAAFWARYTLRRPVPGCGDPVGGLWAVWSSADKGPLQAFSAAGCDTYPVSQVHVGRQRFYLRIGPGELAMGRATGRVSTPAGPLEWALNFETGTPTLTHFPFDSLYRGPFPRNKIVSPHLVTRFFGSILVAGRTITVSGAPGMQGHNWGPAVSSHWVWAHATGFAEEPDAVIEAVSSRLPLGPILSPPLTILALRARGQQVVLRRPDLWLRNRCVLRGLDLHLGGASGDVRIEGQVTARPDWTVGLSYISSDGGKVRCVNSNLASAHVVVTGLPGGRLVLTSSLGATLEAGGLAAPTEIPVQVTG